MKKVELIASDLDGTLLRESEFANNRDIAVIKKTQEQGFKTIIATGRTWSRSHEFAETLEINKHTNLMICNNGAIVTPVSEFKPLLIKTVTVKNANELLTLANKMGLCFFGFFIDGMGLYWNEIQSMSREKAVDDLYHAGNGIVIHKVKDAVGDELISQIMIFTPIDKETAFVNATEKFNKDMVRTKNTSEDVRFYEFNNIEASKGNALRFVANHLNVSMNDVIVFGDNYNDIAMFEAAGTSVAMGNAPDEVKAYATKTTLDVSAGGVSEYLNQFVIKK